VFVDGTLSWVGAEQGWRIERRFEPDTLVTSVQCSSEALGLTLRCSDCVDFHESVLMRKIVVQNQREQLREVRIFFHHDLRISESEVADPAAYLPDIKTLIHYKGWRYFLVNVMVDGTAGIDSFATGQKGAPGRDGTWRDAEDGHLSRN